MNGLGTVCETCIASKYWGSSFQSNCGLITGITDRVRKVQTKASRSDGPSDA